MKEIKGLILCSGGYSSSIISKRLNELGEEYNLKFDEGGFGKDNILELANKYDLILFAPHLSMHFDDFEDALEDKKVPLIQIQSKEYASSNVEILFERILRILGL
ncbi:PTS sugar transporter subunit IIB [Spiroplasma cantharicola]|uniref:PTS EIIB type-3 domain-containing protein n=1 Tax=Spiroplasma cantharicola TaxID=362837 RepID=A0A0M4KER5_9MOLU|nr:hypothetical protein [Spiroplasma cantharicola]ALD66532.1 hypothetical protein SCANT_v1c06260 [Spiroplasma cantharicola]